ncbi:MAG: hypothetical protein ACK4MX_12095 [Thermaurantiacus sp.]
MARLNMKKRLEFDRLTETGDRLVYAILDRLACDGHGDWGSCGVAEFDLIEFAEAVDEPPGDLLRRLLRIATLVEAVCVEHEKTVLFALAGAMQDGFDHLYKSRGFEGLPPNLPRVKPRFLRI